MAGACRAASPAARGLRLAVRLVVVVLVVLVRFVVGIHEIRRVEERALLRPDVDERGLNARQDCFDSSEVDVADHAARFGTIDQKFNELVVLEDGDPRLARVRVDQNFSFHQCPSLVRLRRLGGTGAMAFRIVG